MSGRLVILTATAGKGYHLILCSNGRVEDIGHPKFPVRPGLSGGYANSGSRVLGLRLDGISSWVFGAFAIRLEPSSNENRTWNIW